MRRRPNIWCIANVNKTIIKKSQLQMFDKRFEYLKLDEFYFYSLHYEQKYTLKTAKTMGFFVKQAHDLAYI